VCVEFDVIEGLVEGEQGCSWGIRYRSAIGFGSARIVEDLREKQDAMKIVMSQYSDRTFSFPEASLNRMTMIKVSIETLTGKQSKRL
jgi:uncharacterized protein